MPFTGVGLSGVTLSINRVWPYLLRLLKENQAGWSLDLLTSFSFPVSCVTSKLFSHELQDVELTNLK